MVYGDWLIRAHHSRRIAICNLLARTPTLPNAMKCGRSSNKQGKDARIRPSHVNSPATWKLCSSSLWMQVFQRFALIPVSQQALPPRFAGFRIHGPCKCFSVYISFGKPWLGMIIPETKAVGWISRLLTLEAPFMPYAEAPCSRAPRKRLAGEAKVEEGGCWDLYFETLYRTTHHTDDNSWIRLVQILKLAGGATSLFSGRYTHNRSCVAA